MGFWYTDTQDRNSGAWHWTGIAISLAQTLGLHRCPGYLTNKQQPLPEKQVSLLRRIWWTCIVRDRWLSLVKGRPMRIHDDDCDVPMPIAEDVTNELEKIPSRVHNKFLPTESTELAKMWIRLVGISVSLGNILRTHYRPKGPRPGVEDIENCAAELRSFVKGHDTSVWNDSCDVILRLHGYQLDLFYECACSLLG